LSAAGAAAGGGDADRDVAASPSPAATATAPAVVPAEVPATIVMPDLVGLNLQEAQDSLQALGSYFLDQEDALGEGRVQLVDSNWQVCSQEPASGAEMPLEATVLLTAVKLDEACPGAAPVE